MGGPQYKQPKRTRRRDASNFDVVELMVRTIDENAPLVRFICCRTKMSENLNISDLECATEDHVWDNREFAFIDSKSRHALA